MADNPTDAEKYLASLSERFGGTATDIGNGLLRDLVIANLYRRNGLLPSRSDVDAELDRMLEEARTSVALDRLDRRDG